MAFRFLRLDYWHANGPRAYRLATIVSLGKYRINKPDKFYQLEGGRFKSKYPALDSSAAACQS